MRHFTFFITIFLFTFLIKCNASHNYFFNQEQSYVDSLNKLVDILKSGTIPGNDLLLFCIPTTQEDASKFFELDYNKDETYNRIFHEINALWENKCASNKTLFLIKYLEYSQFVDGYFAEDYFISINKIYKAIGPRLCNKLNNCTESKIKRIRLYMEEKNYCNN